VRLVANILWILGIWVGVFFLIGGVEFYLGSSNFYKEVR
jgi:hypothetical protein